jgi:signal transduction histidine kinase
VPPANHVTQVSAPRQSPASPRRRIGTAGRLASLHAFVLAVILAAVVVGSYVNLTNSYASVARDSLTARAANFQTAAEQRVAGIDLHSFAVHYVRTTGVPPGDTLILVTADGRVTAVGSDAARLAAAAPVAAALPVPTATVFTTTSVAGVPEAVLIVPLTIGAKPVASLVLATSIAVDTAARARVLHLAIVEALIAWVAGSLSAFLVLRRLLRTVGRITTTADRISEGRLDERLGDQGTDDEVGQLADSFDAMLDKLGAAASAQRQMLADISHQMRTPLTVVRGHLEVLELTGLDDPAATAETVHLVVDELDHMRQLVDRLLLLGRAMEPDRLRPEPIDLRSFVGDLFETCRVIAPRAWELGPVADAILVGDEAMLRGAILNLVDNAIRATAESGTIELSAAAVDGSNIAITVADSGPGIPAAQRAAVLERFARPGARDADGSGLGLSIVRAVSVSHGGSVTIGDSAHGGAQISMLLPLAGPGRGKDAQ